MKNNLHKVTPLSKTLAIVAFISFIFSAFFLGKSFDGNDVIVNDVVISRDLVPKTKTALGVEEALIFDISQLSKLDKYEYAVFEIGNGSYGFVIEDTENNSLAFADIFRYKQGTHKLPVGMTKDKHFIYFSGSDYSPKEESGLNIYPGVYDLVKYNLENGEVVILDTKTCNEAGEYIESEDMACINRGEKGNSSVEELFKEYDLEII